jgi:hypothetical protein
MYTTNNLSDITYYVCPIIRKIYKIDTKRLQDYVAKRERTLSYYESDTSCGYVLDIWRLVDDAGLTSQDIPAHLLDGVELEGLNESGKRALSESIIATLTGGTIVTDIHLNRDCGIDIIIDGLWCTETLQVKSAWLAKARKSIPYEIAEINPRGMH